MVAKSIAKIYTNIHKPTDYSPSLSDQRLFYRSNVMTIATLLPRELRLRKT